MLYRISAEMSRDTALGCVDSGVCLVVFRGPTELGFGGGCWRSRPRLNRPGMRGSDSAETYMRVSASGAEQTHYDRPPPAFGWWW